MALLLLVWNASIIRPPRNRKQQQIRAMRGKHGPQFVAVRYASSRSSRVSKYSDTVYAGISRTTSINLPVLIS
jgi:hypothetical protein